MSVFAYFLLFFIVFLVAVFMTWGMTEISRLQSRIRGLLSRAESDRRVFNLFVHKLATENEVVDAMNILAPQICEDLDAESVGIFIPDGVDKDGKEVLRGISCTGYFPVFSMPHHRFGVTTKIFENLRYRMEVFRRELIRPEDGLLGELMQTHKPFLLNSDSPQLSEYPLPREVYTMMVLPLLIEERFSGLLVVVNRNHDPRPFTEESMSLLAELSTMVGLTSSLIMIYSDRAQQDRIKRELEFCSELQKSLLPQIPPCMDDLALSAVNKPCHEVSGDFYDYLELSDDLFLIMVADATGKGIPACMMTSMCRSFVRSLAERYHGLQPFMLDLNRLVYENSDRSHFLTANVLVINRRTHQCEYACAGHPPLFVSHVTGEFEELKPDGTALGMWPNDFAEFETMELSLDAGIQLCMYTDGLNEALNNDGDEYGMKRLAESWKTICSRRVEPRRAIDRLLASTDDFADGAPQADDQTVIVICRQADYGCGCSSDAPSPSSPSSPSPSYSSPLSTSRHS